MADKMIRLNCYECGKETQKKEQYIKARKREGRDKFFCGRKCASARHSKSMSGEGNPNYNGTWYGDNPYARLTKEERSKRAKRQFERYKETGEIDAVMERLSEGHRQFFNTEEGKAIRRRNGVNTVKILSQGKRTTIEAKMADELLARGIDFEEQRDLGGKFLLDFFLPEYGIVIECDGDYWHRLPQNARRDKAKNAYIRACGYSLYRFWEREINTDVAACVDVVMAEINAKEAAV